MNIIHYTIGTTDELVEKLRRVRLRGTIGGVQQPQVYQNARISLQRRMDIEKFLFPPQRYVLKGTVDSILALEAEFSKYGVDIFALEGALYFWLEGMDPEKDQPIPFLPPIVEESYERGERVVFLVNDGMHRVWSARKLRRSPNVVLIQDIPEEYPYYAYAITTGWETVVEFDEIPDVFQKKDYRNPDNYKALFRDFNAQFPGVQKDRKQSNPSHIKQ